MNRAKLLIVSSYAPPAIGGPQNLYNLLRDADPESYTILTSFYNIDDVSAQKGTWLRGKYLFYDKPGATRETLKNQASSGKSSATRSIFSKLKYAVKRTVLAKTILGIPIILSQVFMIVSAGKKAIRQENPTSLLAFSDYGPALIGTYILHKLTHVPYSLFMFDLYKGNFFPFPGGFLARIFEATLFRNAQKIVLTNTGTKDYYAKRYDSLIVDKMVIIYNSAFPEPFLKDHISHSPKPPYQIFFTGRISWPQAGSLKNLIRAVEEIMDLDVHLKIYTPSPRDYLAKMGIVESSKISFDMAPPQEMPAIQSQADILFLPLSWHTKSQAIIDTATPGKFTDYLMAGKPILVHSPASSFLSRYSKEHQVALVVDEENIEQLKAGIRKLLLDSTFGANLVRNARNIFLEHYDAHKNAKLFQELFLT